MAVVGADPAFRITAWDTAAEHLLGWAAEEAIGRLAPELLPTAGRRERVQNLRRRGWWTGQITVETKDEGPIVCEMWVVTLRDGGVARGYTALLQKSVVNSDNSPRRSGEGRQAGGYTLAAESATVTGSMSTITSAGRQHIAELRARLGRDLTIEDLLEQAGREIALERRHARIRKTIAVRIHDARLDAGLTQVELAARLGKRDKEVNRWEHAHRMPSHASRELLAAALDIPLTRLYPEQEPDDELVALTPAEDDELLG
jgi:ribosome-binding protein aMBF1 (putative translation factor)